jgi:hypothetical protein
MAKAIATSIKEINNFDLGKFLVDQKEFPPNYNAKKQSPVAPCHFPHKLKKSSDEKTLGKNNNIELVLQMKNIEKLIIGNVTFCYYDNYFGPY